ncbi:MAG: heavy-metal-associated domain-containing protein [Bacteroidaceae bacterium]|nr:heavy-metal-associated domain-containing protein [Bacteroidaceae bacterium]
MNKTLSMMAVALMMSVTTMAGDLKVLVVKTSPAVQSVEAKTKVKDQLRLTAGVKKVEANFADQEVFVTYDSAKTDQKKIVAALKKAGYETTVVSDGTPKEKKQVPVDATSGASQQQKK